MNERELSSDQYDALVDLFEGARTRPDKLNEWETNFISSLEQRFDQYGTKTMVSPRQWPIVKKCLNKLY